MRIVIGVSIVLLAYLLGSVPVAYILARAAKGIDIRRVGTGNPGTMNTMRQVGMGPGLLVLVLDMAKGFLSVFVSLALGLPLVVAVAAGLAAMAGQMWPLFLGFQGGRGAATGLGTLLALTPGEFGIAFALIVVVFLLTQNTGASVGSGLILLPVLVWAGGGGWDYIFAVMALSAALGLRSLPDLAQEVKAAGSLRALVARKHLLWGKRKE